MAQQDPEYLGYHPGAELIFAIVCPLGTPYKRVAEALDNYLSQFGYKTEPIQVSDYFDDLLQKLGSELKPEGDDPKAIALHKIAAGIRADSETLHRTARCVPSRAVASRCTCPFLEQTTI